MNQVKTLARKTSVKALSQTKEATPKDAVDLSMQHLGIGIDTARYGHRARIIIERTR